MLKVHHHTVELKPTQLNLSEGDMHAKQERDHSNRQNTGNASKKQKSPQDKRSKRKDVDSALQTGAPLFFHNS